MNNEQEYIKFWINVKDKVDEVSEDYNNLSGENKSRVDNVMNLIFQARNMFEIINILNSQVER